MSVDDRRRARPHVDPDHAVPLTFQELHGAMADSLSMSALVVVGARVVRALSARGAAATGKLISITVELFVRPVRSDPVLYRGR